MKGLLTLAIVVAASAVDASRFQRVLGGREQDRGVFVTPTKDAGYVVVGVTKSTGEGEEDIYVVKFDSTGEPLWTRTYGGPDDDNGWSIHEIDDGYVVAGYTKSFGSGGFDFYLLNIGADGAIGWSQTYGGTADDRCWGLLPTPDGGYALIGETRSSGAGEEDCFLIKTDASGEAEWSRTYGGEKGDRCFSIASTNGGGFLLAGQTFSDGAGDRDAYLIKVDATGSEEWSRTFGGPASDVAHSVVRTTDANFFVTGYTTSFAATGDDPYLIKIDSQGDTLWTRTLPTETITRTITGDQGADGGFFMTGFDHNPMQRSGAALLIRADRDGHFEWSKRFLETTAGQSFGYTVRATDDGGCVFTGHTTVDSAGELDLFILKVDPDGR